MRQGTVIDGSGNGLSPVRANPFSQPMSIETLGIKFGEIEIKVQQFSFNNASENVVYKMSPM